VNSVLLVANIIAGRFYFFRVGAGPDGIEPAWHQWLDVMWILGPLWSVGSFVVAFISRKKSWETWANAAISVAYVFLWWLVLVM
jgi:hypothetical protein